MVVPGTIEEPREYWFRVVTELWFKEAGNAKAVMHEELGIAKSRAKNDR